MILTALKELAEAEHLMADPDFEPKPVTRVIELAPDGRLLGVTDLRQPDAKGKPRAVTLLVPKIAGRTSGVSPQFLYDKSDYVFGVSVKKDGPPMRTDRQLEAAISTTANAAGQAGDDGLSAVQRFLERQRDAPDRATGLPEDFDPSDWFVFRLSGSEGFVHEQPAVRQWWRGSRQVSGGVTATCLITGERCIPVEKHDAIKKVPGGSTSGVAIVSFNSDAFESYGLERNGNAPVSRYAAEAYVRGLNRLLDPRYPHPERAGETLPPRRVRLGSDTAVVFWTADPAHPFADDVFACLTEPTPEVVGRMLRAPATGRPAYPEEGTRFFALTLSGGQGRATIRDWYTTSVGEMAGRIRRWFEDLYLAFPFEQAPLPALNDLLRSTVLEGKDDAIAPNLAAEASQALLRDGPLPLTLLHAAIRRNKAEGPLSGRSGRPQWNRAHLRMQLVKAVLCRLRRQRKAITLPEIPAMLDETNTHPAYVLGRMFALLESLQGAAQGQPNATIGDRFYGAAAATPNTVFPRLLALSRHHLHKVRGERPGLAHWYDARLGAVANLAPAKPFPAVFSMEEQGLFALGYYHQRQSRGGAAEGEAAEAEAQG